MNDHPLFDLRRLFKFGALSEKPQPGEAALEPVNLEAFPFLFMMQAVQGLSGVIFCVGWFAVLLRWYPEFWNRTTTLVGIWVLLAFTIICGIAVVIPFRIMAAPAEAAWDRIARSWMTWLVVLFAIVCGVLVWLTDGLSSPFIPFYVMVFTLVLTKCSIPHPGQSVLLFYVFVFSIACVVGWQVGPPVDHAVLLSIKDGSPKAWADFVFVILSMIVPYFGTWLSTWLAGAMAVRRPATPAQGA